MSSYERPITRRQSARIKKLGSPIVVESPSTGTSRLRKSELTSERKRKNPQDSSPSKSIIKSPVKKSKVSSLEQNSSSISFPLHSLNTSLEIKSKISEEKSKSLETKLIPSSNFESTGAQEPKETLDFVREDERTLRRETSLSDVIKTETEKDTHEITEKDGIKTTDVEDVETRMMTKPDVLSQKSAKFEIHKSQNNQRKIVNPTGLVRIRPLVMSSSRAFCKSGRFWKSPRDRFNSLITPKGLKSSLAQKNQLKEDLKNSKILENSLREENKKRKQDLRERQEANKKKREENAKKAEIYQQIKNPIKIKRMKKKQLRLLAKRDVTKSEGFR